ncbi:ABC transporter permease [Salipaludibacillus sp. CF4.18]|uniref:ABC transporter permease n=1 Tax=Salipaludibacillus sp. CF4.18 TaxID=3373081 RepID=UPI003EE73DD7
MQSLIHNEWIKLWNKKQPWFFLGAIVVLIIGMVVIYDNFLIDSNNQSTGEWEVTLETEIAEQEEIIEMNNGDEVDIEFAEQIIQENKAMLEAGVNPNEMYNAKFLNDSIFAITAFVTLFSVIIASTIVSSEQDNGTLKQLFIRPFERWQFLLAKFITVVLFSMILLATLIITNLTVGTIFFGSGSFSTPIIEITMQGGKIITTVEEVLPAKIGLYFLNMLMFLIISFSVSILFKSQTLAVGIGIFILFATNVMQALTGLLGDYMWYKLLFLPHLSLPSYVLVDELLPGVGLGFSLAVLAVYAILFLGSATIFFQKRDLSS